MSEERTYGGHTLTELGALIRHQQDAARPWHVRMQHQQAVVKAGHAAALDLLNRVEELEGEQAVFRSEMNDVFIAQEQECLNLVNETTLLREYVALLEQNSNLDTPRERAYRIVEGKRLRAAIAAATQPTNEHDEAVVGELFADAPRKAGRARVNSIERRAGGGGCIALGQWTLILPSLGRR